MAEEYEMAPEIRAIYRAEIREGEYSAAFTSDIESAQLSIEDEPTRSDMPDPTEARLYIEQATNDLFTLFMGTRLEPLAQHVAWGWVNSLHRVAAQLAKEEDRAARELGELVRINDPSEIHARNIENQQRIYQSAFDAMSALECMRDHAADIYRVEVGKVWTPASGGRTGGTKTASQIDGQALLAERANAKRDELLPNGPIVLVSGGKSWTDKKSIRDRLDQIKKVVRNFTIATTAQIEGADAFALEWAEENRLKTVRFKLPPLNPRKHDNRAYQRNNKLVALGPIEAIICEGSTVQTDLAEKCRSNGIFVSFFRNAMDERKRGAA